MINFIYRLVSPGSFSVEYKDIDLSSGVIVRPRYMAVCHADQRYFLGKRDATVLRKKLPMALIHECCGEVIRDNTGKFAPGQNVVMIPNVPPENHENFIYENYAKGAKFLSSGVDGFMREFINLPADRLIPFNGVPLYIAAICEFISVAVHAVDRFKKTAHNNRGKIGVWGDGSMAYTLACVLKELMPESKIAIIGKNTEKLSQFMFVDETYMTHEIPADFEIDHAFECAGGEGSYFAIDDIIKFINPQGTAILIGVSENKIAINTRDVLEKGLTITGVSRSGRKDFEVAVRILENIKFQNRIKRIIYEDEKVSSIQDLYRVFKNDLENSFKTVFEWNM